MCEEEGEGMTYFYLIAWAIGVLCLWRAYKTMR